MCSKDVLVKDGQFSPTLVRSTSVGAPACIASYGFKDWWLVGTSKSFAQSQYLVNFGLVSKIIILILYVKSTLFQKFLDSPACFQIKTIYVEGAKL